MNQKPIKLFIGTPSIDQKVNVGYLYTIFNMNSLLPEVETSLFIVSGNSVITDARNRIASVFYSSNADYLLFLDSDVEVNTQDILKILKFKKDIVGLPVLKKNYINPKLNIGNYVEDLNNGLIEVDGISTSALLISRKVISDFVKVSNYYYDNNIDLINNTSITQEKIYDIFKIFSENGKYWNEDYYFCHEARTKFGYRVYAYMKVTTNHYGVVPFNYQY